MQKKCLTLIIFIFTIIYIQALNSEALTNHNKFIHHNLQVQINPDQHFLWVTDKITIPASMGNEKLKFILHGNLTINYHSSNIRLKKEKGEIKSDFFGINFAVFDIKKNTPLVCYSLTRLKNDKNELRVILSYEGQINHPISPAGSEYARGFSETAGIISPQGFYLAGSSFWIPWFNGNLITYRFEVTLPETWDSVCSGNKISEISTEGFKKTVWDSATPVHEPYLVGGQFVQYQQSCENTRILALLKSPDEALANKYLETTCLYLKMYNNLIGPYPYSRFALVENFWETGYGMPSFTLLGPKIIRFPFILHSSYPHELLHNWWGNSVFVDYQAGNWCEGITVYLADHLIKEQREQGDEYRRTTLQNYSDYVSKKKDMPLTDFRARYDATSSAIGYGKSMMFFHMLRNLVGDQLFIKSLRHFYKHNKFKLASFENIRKSFELITGKNLKSFFQQWIHLPGAPVLKMSNVKVSHLKNQYQIGFRLSQLQGENPYQMDIPVSFHLDGHKQENIQKLHLNKKNQDFKFSFSARPLSLKIDPKFDIFRRVDPREVPPALSRAFGSNSVLVIIPENAVKNLISGYENLAKNWYDRSNIHLVAIKDSDIKKLPGDKTVWIFGWENKFKSRFFEMLKKYGIIEEKTTIQIHNTKLEHAGKSFVFTARNPLSPSQVVVFLATDVINAFNGLSRKLPHYSKYSYLIFDGDEPTNIQKGQWPVIDSPLFIKLTDSSVLVQDTGKTIPSRKPLIELPPVFSKTRMMEHIVFLSSPGLKGRGITDPEIKKAAEYISTHFKNAGLDPGGENGTYFQKWKTEHLFLSSGNKDQKIELINVIGILPGQKQEFEGQAVILCAHYDHLGFEPALLDGQQEKIFPGADDNASGVSVMLELSRYLGSTVKPDRSIIFIAFTGEEKKLLGSDHYLTDLNRDRIKNIIGVINLDTVGRLNNNKLLVIGGSSAREWKFIFMGISYTTGVETELISQEIDSSDQVSFIKRGIPAVQLFSGPHLDFHKPTDTIDKIDAEGLVKVAEVAKEAVVYLSHRKESLTIQKPVSSKAVSKSSQSKRRVKTGMMPDFSFSGNGVKVGMVSENSPARKSGLQKGDIIIKLGNFTVGNLKEYARVLSSFKPGDQTTITYLRKGKEFTVKIILVSR